MWLYENILKKCPLNKLVARYLMNPWLDRIQIWCGGSLAIFDIFDDLIIFCKKNIKN